jgi:hypothetical protein
MVQGISRMDAARDLFKKSSKAAKVGRFSAKALSGSGKMAKSAVKVASFFTKFGILGVIGILEGANTVRKSVINLIKAEETTVKIDALLGIGAGFSEMGFGLNDVTAGTIEIVTKLATPAAKMVIKVSVGLAAIFALFKIALHTKELISLYRLRGRCEEVTSQDKVKIEKLFGKSYEKWDTMSNKITKAEYLKKAIDNKIKSEALKALISLITVVVIGVILLSPQALAIATVTSALLAVMHVSGLLVTEGFDFIIKSRLNKKMANIQPEETEMQERKSGQ